MEISYQKINPEAIEICKILKKAKCQAYLVGGCVRDLLLGLEPKDWDIASDALPEEIMVLFPKHYPTGLEHGTITIALNNQHFEVTTFRTEGKYLDGRHPEKVFFVSDITQDLLRRDFTINAMAYDPLTKTLIDPFDGQKDLNNQIIKAVGEANIRFEEDALRIMRAARFAARFGYTIDHTTFKSMIDNVELLTKISKERIKDELTKTLLTKIPDHGINILSQIGAFKTLNSILSKHVINNIVSCLSNCQGDLECKIALLYSYCPINLVEKELINLKFSNFEIKKVLFLLNILQRYRDFAQKDTVDAYKAFIAIIKNLAPLPWDYVLNQFIRLAEALGYGIIRHLEQYQNEIVIPRKEMELNGNDIISLGVPIGAQIKFILDKCYLNILKYPENNNKKYLLKLAQELM